MLKHISLYCINKIFETEALVKISPKAKVAYIQCLVFHFEDLEPSHENTEAFDILKTRVKPRSLPLFEEMAKAGLVQINDKWITFVSLWQKHIDKSAFKRVTPTEYMAISGYKPAEEYMADILSNQSFYDLTGMQLKLSKERTTELIQLFFKTQEAHKQPYANYTAASRHCLGWIRNQVFPSNYSNSKTTTNNATKRIEPGKNYGSL